ncbi:signal peptidase I [Paenibacillus sp. UNCCL117]|uniref:signal peptidase I n=1 Tax=unclassified Paenibacillus TaxID=185978 RepID=UPI000886AE2F|nr:MULTISPECIES: signal peptidase I [unclassified Paenibacillus]SDE63417.1 signal peptidase I [Paenibacillus sp. cl123]SFW70127.1 signal peptidase I [Paenibacillus sp. UNCCL117]
MTTSRSSDITRLGWSGIRKGERTMTEASPKQAGSKGIGREIWEWFKIMVIAMIVVTLVHHFLFHVSAVKGGSMHPTLHEGEWLFINKTVRYLKPPGRGDIVVLRSPDESGLGSPYLVKRIVAVAGDEVHVRRGKLFINGREAEESYTDSLIQDGRFEPLTVAQGFVFVMGDNRRRYASNDSRSFGSVPLELVVGKAERVIWPIRQWRSL